MADDYDKNRAFGKPENIEKRLAMWSVQLGTDKSLPWVGLGLIDDLKCACRMLGGDPDKRYADIRKPKPAPEPQVEYDL
jgi:hypothetical protein